MSFGKTSSNNQQQQQSQSQQQLDPQIKAALLGNYANAQSLNTPYQPFTGEQVAPLNPTQLAAQQGILGLVNSNVGGSELANAANTTNAVAGYQPMQVGGPSSAYTAATGGASTAGPASLATASQIDPNAVQNVTAPTVGADQINAFLNPYTQSVVNTTNQQLLQQYQIAQAANAAKATQAGAFGGSGSAVLDALSNLNYQQTLGSTDANLMASGYNTALTAAQQQAAQQLAAQQANQQTNLSAGTTNAGLANQVGLANAAALNTQGQFNAGQQQQMGLANLNAQNAAGQFNAGQAQQAQLANQQAGLTNAQLGLQAGSQQAQLSAQQMAQALGLQQAAANVGQQTQTQQQAQDTANYNTYLQAQQWPLMLQQLMNQSLGLAGNPVLGSSSASGTSSGSSSGFNVALPTPSGG